ncbi:MAG: primosomal protein N' [Lachnospiraceae bacterium]|nr:primosomal protein N' [Lachnospiraceae bacterium]
MHEKDLYADIIIDIAHEKVDRPFQYRIPQSLREKLEVGMSVNVPFGKGNTMRKGYVMGISDKTDYDPAKIKNLHSIAKGDVSAENRMIKLAAWLRRTYGGTMIQALKTVMPAKQSVKTLEKKTVVLRWDRQEAEEYYFQCIKKNRKAQARLLKELLELQSLPYHLVTSKLNVSGTVIKTLENQGIIKVETQEYYRNPIKMSETKQEGKNLSESQKHIVREIMADYDKGQRQTYLIHGITGSGKTEVYMKLIEEVVARGKQAIVLIPEIALTYQTVVRFYKRFGDRVSVMNSTLSDGEKFDQCRRAAEGDIDVIIGPRSALFTPFPDLGLIVIDEEHEGTYKSESSPKYHARETAEEIARVSGASVVLGSATPSIEAYYRAKQQKYKMFRLTERLTGGHLPKVYVADLREELKNGNRSIFSMKMQELIEDRLQKGQQIMLFLNRRGYAGFISCRECGHVMKCPHCDVSLSEHRGGKLVCHYCGYEQPAVNRCPKCGSKYISGFRAGTQQIEEKLKEKYPQARVLRMDADTTKKKDSYEEILSAFANGEADVLIGTQMIVKGHDFPNVTMVGIIAADMSLSVGDYRAGERTFQLLTQAAGRAGRGQNPGEVVIQTYQPEHYSVVHAAAQDYESFYEEEILYRELLQYPPAAHMMAVQIFAKEEAAGYELSNKLGNFSKGLPQKPGEMMIIGPAAASIGKINDVFRFVFYVKCGNYDKLVEVKDLLEEEIQKMQLKRESVQFDFDPMSAF